MEESRGNLQQKKTAMKMGGGGIGAVVLLGGALASAALASAFVVGKNGWSSGKDRRRSRIPSSAVNKQKEQGRAEKGQQQVVVDELSHEDKNPSPEAIKGDESDHDGPFLDSNQSCTQEEKPKSEQNSNETAYNFPDTETSDESLSPITPEKSETDSICYGLVLIEETGPFSVEKPRNEPPNTTHGDEATVELNERDFCPEIPKNGRNLEQILVDEDLAESEPIDGTAQEQIKREEGDETCLNHEEIKVILADKSIEKAIFKENDTETEVRERHNGETMLSENVLEDRFIDKESVAREVFPVEVVEIIKEEDDGRSKCIKEQSVEEEEEEHRKDLIEVIVKDDEMGGGNKEENDLKHHVTPQDMVQEEMVLSEIGTDDQEIDLERDKGKEVEKEPAGSKDDEFTVDRENEELESDIKKEVELEPVENFPVTDNLKNIDRDKGIEEEVEVELISPEPVMKKPNQIKDLEKDNDAKGEETGQDHVKTNILAKIEDSPSETTAITEDDSVKIKNDSIEKSENTTKDLSDGTLLPDEARLSDQEVGGKILEDKSVKKLDHDSRDAQTKSKPEKSIIKKYVDELGISKEVRFVSSTHGMIIIIATLSVASSLWCSWFFGLSFANLCFVVLMTMLFSSMVVQ